MLCGELAVLQAPMFDGLSLDPFALFDDGFSPSEVGIGGRHVVQALVVTLMVVVFDEGLDLAFEVSRQEVVFQQDAVLQCLVPALDLALGLRVEGRAAYMAHAPCLDIVRQFARDVAGAIIAEQPGPVVETWGWSQLDAVCAMSSVSLTSSARIVLQSFQAMM